MKLRFVPVAAVLMFALVAATRGQEPNEKARRYFDTLLKRPAPGAVFDRFYNAWLDTGTLEEMEAFLVRMAEVQKEESGARMILALYYVKQNDHTQAVEQFAKALERDPGSAAAWHQKAIAESRLLDYTAALASLEKALKAAPDKVLEARLRQFQGLLLARDGRTGDALKIWGELLAAHPEDVALREDIIELQTGAGLTKEALATATELLARTVDPYQKVQRRLKIGDLHARMGNRDAAVAAYTECLGDSGADSWLEKEILAQIEQVFRRDDAVEALHAHFSGLLKAWPQRFSLHRAHARLLAEKGKVDEAVQVFQNLLTLAPGDRGVREDYITLLSQGKRSVEAAAQMEILAQLLPADPEPAARLAELRHEAGDAPGAAAAVEMFVSRSDQSESAFLRAAALLERCRQPEPSLALYRRVEEKFPASESARDALALALHRHGHKEEAAAEWRKLAAGADRSRLANVARSAAARDEHALAWELLSARAAEFQTDPVFLSQLCDEAFRLEKYAEGLPHARRLVNLAKDAASLETALTLAIRMADRAQLSGNLLTELASATSPQDRCLRAELLEKAGKRPEAEETLRALTADAPELASALRVRLLSNRGDDAAAARALQALVESPGGQKAVHVQRLVELLVRAVRHEEALRWIAAWKKISPGAVSPWLREASLYQAMERDADALQTLRKASALFEENAELKAALAAAYREDGKYADALRLYTVLYEEAKDIPEKVRLSAELARTAQAAGKTDDLIESFEERRRGNRTATAPLLSLAEIYRFLENYEARRIVLLEAARLAPDNRELRLEIIRTAESEGDWDRAMMMLREMIRHEDTPVLRARLVSMLFNSGREEEAMQEVNSLAASGKLDARGIEALAMPLAASQSWNECMALLEPAVTQFPGDFRLLYLYAVALEENADVSGALAALRALAVAQDVPGAANTAVPGLQVAGGSGSGRLSSSARVAMRAQARNILMRLCPEMAEFQKVAMIGNTAYSHRRDQRAKISSRGQPLFSATGAAVVLPSSLEEAKYMSLPHIKDLTQDNEDARKESVASLESGGLRNAEVFLEMTRGFTTRQSAGPEDLYKKFPDNPLTQVVFATTAIYSSQVDPATVVELVAKLKPARPDVARLLAVSVCASADPAMVKLAEEATREAAELAGSDEGMRPLLINMVLRPDSDGLPFTASNPAASEPDPKVRDVLWPHVIKWYHDAEPADPLRGTLFVLTAARLQQTNDYAGLIRLLEEEMERPAPGGQPPAALAAITALPGRQNAKRLVSPLGFPRFSSQIPDSVASFLRLKNGTISFGPGPSLPPAKLGPLLPGVKDPVLRFSIAFRTGNKSLMESSIPPLQALEKPGAPAALIVAAWLESQKKYTEAADFLRKAPRPLAPGDQEAADAAVIHWALQEKEEEEEEEGAGNQSLLLKDAREAALRQRKAPATSDEDRSALASALETLGLPDEAMRYTAAGAQAQRRAAPAAISRSRLSQPPQRDRVEALLEAGRKDEAVKLLVIELKTMSRGLISTSFNGNTQDFSTWKRRVDQLGLTTELMKAADPGVTDNAGTIAAWGAVQEIFQDPKKAAELYRQALARRPRSTEFLSLGMRAAMKTDPAAAATMVQDADPALLARAASMLAGFSYNVSKTTDRVLMMEALAVRLSTVDPAYLRTGELAWAMQWLGQFGHSGAGEEQRKYGNPLGAVKPQEEFQKDPEVAKVRERWQAATGKAARLLMKNEAQAVPAFGVFVALRNAADPEGSREEGDQLALEILGITGKQFFTWALPGGPELDTTPREWLLVSATRRGDAAVLTGEVIPRLRKAGAVPEADQLEAAARLYFCTEAEFATHVRAILSQPANGNKNQAGQQEAVMSLVVAVMTKRGLDADVDEAMLGAIKDLWRGSRFTRTSLKDYLLHLRKHRGPGALEKFFDKVSDIYLGETRDRAALFAEVYKMPNTRNDPRDTKIREWASMTHSLSWTPELAFPMLKKMETAFLVHFRRPETALDSDSWQAGILGVSRFNNEPLESVLVALRGTAALGEMADFDLPVVVTRGGNPMPESLFKNLKLEESGKLRKMLEAEPQSFGARFLQASMGPNQTEALLALLGTHADELGKLSPARQRRIGLFFRAAGGNPMEIMPKSDLFTRGRAWLAKLEDMAVLEESEGFLKEELASGVDKSAREYGIKVQKMVTRLLQIDPPRAIQCFLKAREQVAADRKAGTANFQWDGYITIGGSNVYSTSVLGSVLLGVAVEMNGSLDAGDACLPVVLSSLATMAATDRGCGVEGSQALSTEMGVLILKAGTSCGEKMEFSLRQLMETLGGAFKPEHLPVLFGPARHAMRFYRPAEEAWLTRQVETGPNADTAMLFISAMRIARQDKEAGNTPRAGTMDPAQMPAEQQWLLRLLGKKSVPPAALASFAGEAIRNWPAAEAPLRHACGQAVAAAWEMDTPVNEEQAMLVVDSLRDLGTGWQMPADAGFQSAMTALAESWRARAMSGKAAYGWPRLVTGYTPLWRLMTSLTLASGLKTEGVRMAVLLDNAMPGSLVPAIPAMLVQFRQFEDARRLLRQTSSSFLQPRQVTGFEWTYSAALHEALPGLLALYESPIDRYRAEFILRALADPEATPGEKPAVPDQNARLLAMAKAWPGDEILKLTDGLALTGFLLNTPGAEEALAPMLDRLGKRKDLTGLLPASDTFDARRFSAAVISAVVNRSLSGGDITSLRKFVNDTRKMPGNAPTAVALRVVHTCLDTAKARWAQWDLPTRQAVSGFYRFHLLERGAVPSSGTDDNLAADWMQLYWMALLDGEEKEFTEKVTGALKENFNNFSNIERTVQREHDLFGILKSLLPPGAVETPESVQIRQAVMLRWSLSDNPLPGFLLSNRTWFHKMIESKWLRLEDVLDRAAEIPVRQSWQLLELMNLATEAKREDTAAKLLELMKSAVAGTEGGMLQLSADLEKTRPADALKVLEFYTDAKLSEKTTSEATRLKVSSGRVYLSILAAAKEGGMEGAMKETAKRFTEKPDDPVVWESVSRAYFAMAKQTTKARNHKEAYRQAYFSLLTAQATVQLSNGKLRGPDEDAYRSCLHNLSAFERDPAASNELKTPAGIARLAEELGPVWNVLPEASRKRLRELSWDKPKPEK